MFENSCTLAMHCSVLDCCVSSNIFGLDASSNDNRTSLRLSSFDRLIIAPSVWNFGSSNTFDDQVLNNTALEIKTNFSHHIPSVKNYSFKLKAMDNIGTTEKLQKWNSITK